MARAWANQPTRAFTLKGLADAAYPSNANKLPVNKGFYYSNRANYILAAMIAPQRRWRVLDQRDVGIIVRRSSDLDQSQVAGLFHADILEGPLERGPGCRASGVEKL